MLDRWSKRAFRATQAEQAKATELKIQAKHSALNSDAPYFVDYLQQQLVNELPTRDLARQSYRVYTTIDMDLQRAADKAVNDTLTSLDPIFAKRKKNSRSTGHAPSGARRFECQDGRDTGDSRRTRLRSEPTQSSGRREPATRLGVQANRLCHRANSAYDENAEEKIHRARRCLWMRPRLFCTVEARPTRRRTSVRRIQTAMSRFARGLVHSLNVVTVRIAEKVGYSKIARMAEKLGLPRLNPSLPWRLERRKQLRLQVASAYTRSPTAVASESRPIKRVTNSDGVGLTETNRNQTGPETGSQLADDQHHAGRVEPRHRCASTSDGVHGDRRRQDRHFARRLVCRVYIRTSFALCGSASTTTRSLGLKAPNRRLPIWTSFMKAALALRPELCGENFPPAPDSIVNDEIDPTTGLVSTDQCPAHKTEYFIEGTQPQQIAKPTRASILNNFDARLRLARGASEIEDRARKAVRDAEKGVDDAAREMKKADQEGYRQTMTDSYERA